MSRLQSLRLAAALEVCPDQLDILGHIQTVQISREHEPAVEKTEPIRLRRDCQYVSQQVSELHLEMEEEQSFSSLQQVVEEKEQKKKAEHMRRFITASFGHNTNHTHSNYNKNEVTVDEMYGNF
ncbi:hypothetical protein E3U43_020231 [Larimichthys crocea]|uniref:Uncharacterized protein n=1 Tax=Larimichthys crocea TaxID=215358 RepID=A0ACD3QVS9_LARCR|nr:hypothetical protein E3U43_020231 [Larimichthys crocea]